RHHGHSVRRRVTFCVRHVLGGPVAYPLLLPAETGLAGRTGAPVGGPVGGPPAERGPECTTMFTGAAGSEWGAPANWSAGLPGGHSSYGCIPSGYPGTVVFDGTAETPTEIGGVSAANTGGLMLNSGQLTLSNGGQASSINNLDHGHSAVTLAEGVT